MISLVDASGGRMLTTETALPAAIVPTQTGLTFTADITFEEWSAIGQSFGRGMESVAWCIGDWLVYGESTFSKRVDPETYDAAVAATGLDRQTLKDYAVVCRTLPAANRREGLSFAHHRALAQIPAEKRDAWSKVVSETTIRPTVRRLRASIRIAGDGSPRIATDKELLDRMGPGGHDNYVPHLLRLKSILIKTLPGMDGDQRAALKEDLQPLLALIKDL